MVRRLERTRSGFLLVGEQFPHARPLLHPFEMCHAILKRGNIEVELGAASKAPEEVRINGSKMVKKPFATGKLVVRNLIVLEKLLLCEPPHGFVRAGEVANPWGRIDAGKERMDTRGAPSQQ